MSKAEKINPVLGAAIHQHLIRLGIESPLTTVRYKSNEPPLRAHVKKEIIAKSFETIMQTLGLDLTDDSLRDTPNRVAKMYVDEIFYGLDYDNFPACTAVTNKCYHDMLIEKNINVQSNCEHHFVVISGKATVAYIPKEKVLGLSKINRVVEFFSKRPQIQERLTAQIYHALTFILDTQDVAVLVDAEHYCVKSRGIEDVGSSTVTVKLGGVFMETAPRAEFLAIARSK